MLTKGLTDIPGIHVGHLSDCDGLTGFTGKLRDNETGLDFFGARYLSGAQGRFTSADPAGIMKQKLVDPQQWNMYSYVRNNPLRFLDPKGMYLSNCAVDDKKCNKAMDDFDNQRKKDLKSKNSRVRLAAESYGGRGEDNGVHVGFADKGWFQQQGKPEANAITNPYKSGHGKTDIEVTFKYGEASADNVAHEGTHVMHDQSFLNSWNPATQTYSSDRNFVSFFTEEAAYAAQAAVTPTAQFGPYDTKRIDNFLQTSPAYKDHLYDQIFPNGSQFPQAPSPDE